MTDIILSSFLSLFALFGKEEQVDEERAKAMLVNYLRHHFGIRNIDTYIGLYDGLTLRLISPLVRSMESAFVSSPLRMKLLI